MKKAYGYLRVSSQGQLDGDGPDRQRDKIRRYCRANGIKVVGWYQESETGTKQDRPELARLMVDLENNGDEVKTVVIERLDRLARDIMVQEAIIQDFDKLGVQLISAAEGPDLCSNDPNRTLIRHMFGAIAQYDKTMLVQKLRAARERKRKSTGRCEGPKPYGEDSEDERKVIRTIRLLRRKKKDGLKGKTCQEIADILNAKGELTKHGRQWTAQLVHYFATKDKKRQSKRR